MNDPDLFILDELPDDADDFSDLERCECGALFYAGVYHRTKCDDCLVNMGVDRDHK